VGREVAIACAAEQRALLLDIGGRSATIVLEDAEMELALEGVVAGALTASGQGRAPASRLLVHRKPCRDFTERLAEKLQALRVGDGLAPETDLGPLINDVRLKRTHAFSRQGQKEGARLVCGGEALREGEHRKGFFYAPTLFADATPAMRIARDPAFGPALVLLQVGSLEEALEMAERTGVRSGLAIYTRRLDLACRAIDRTAVTAVSINAPVGSAAARRGAPGRPGAEAFSEWRSVVMSPGRGWRRAAGTVEGAGGSSGGPERPRG
jgi:aldehyde dehydrogenase (NAD+)